MRGGFLMWLVTGFAAAFFAMANCSISSDNDGQPALDVPQPNWDLSGGGDQSDVGSSGPDVQQPPDTGVALPEVDTTPDTPAADAGAGDTPPAGDTPTGDVAPEAGDTLPAGDTTPAGDTQPAPDGLARGDVAPAGDTAPTSADTSAAP